VTDAYLIIVFLVTGPEDLIGDPKTAKENAKTELLTNLACPPNPGVCTFWKHKPCGSAPNIERCLTIDPNQISSFVQ